MSSSARGLATSWNLHGRGSSKKTTPRPSKNSAPTAIEHLIKSTTSQAISIPWSFPLPAIETPQSTGDEPQTADEESLWDLAYEELRKEKAELIDSYERLLSKEIEQTGEASTETGNLIDQSNRQKRREQLLEITTLGLRRTDEKKITYHVAGHEFNLQDQIATAVQVIQWGQDLVTEAVKASPEASLAWCAVSLVLPLFTRPGDAEHASQEGFAYITGRAMFYVSLEPQLLPKNTDESVMAKEVRESLQNTIIDLYRCILEYQISAVLRFFRNLPSNIVRDLAQPSIWDDMLSDVKIYEEILSHDMDKIHDAAVRQHLTHLNESTLASLDAAKRNLFVNERQLQVTTDILHEIREIREIRKSPRKILASSTEQMAIYNSRENERIPFCQQGTRLSILGQIQDWADAPDSPTVLWLYGPAGTGKSVISQTVAKRLAEWSQLAASFLFNMQKSQRNNLDSFFPTIASQLCVSIPEFETYLHRSIGFNEDIKISDMGLSSQLETLLLKPLSDLPGTHQGTKVIVVDALDECRDRNGVVLLCKLLSKIQDMNMDRIHRHGPETLVLHVFLTSRLDPDISRELKRGLCVRILPLIQWNLRDETVYDIKSVLTERLKDIKNRFTITQEPWPTPEEMDKLIDMATTPSPLFIYVATVCRFVGDDRRNSPIRRLEAWLKQDNKYMSQLDGLYTNILNDLLHSTDMDGNVVPMDSEEEEQLHIILGAMAVLQTPLSTRHLASLLDLNVDDVSRWLENLHAVLDISSNKDEPVTMVHESFRNYLLDRKRQDKSVFHVDEHEAHGQVVLGSLKLMDKKLIQNVCRVKDPCTLVNRQDDILAEKHLDLDMQYACQFWIRHLLESDAQQRQKLDSAIVDFLQRHYLHWLEGLSVLKMCEVGLPSTRDYEKIKALSAESLECAKLLADSTKFAFDYREVIIKCPLQIYDSPFMICPPDSAIRPAVMAQRGFQPRARMIHSSSIYPVTPPEVIPNSRYIPHTIVACALSPNEAIFVMATNERVLQVLEKPAEMIEAMGTNNDEVCEMGFSPDSKTLATLGQYGGVQLWNMDTRTCTMKIKKIENANPGYALSRAIHFIPGRNMIAIFYGYVTVLYDTASGAYIDKMMSCNSTDSTKGQCIAISPDGNTIAISVPCNSDNSHTALQLWNMDNRHYTQFSCDGPVVSMVWSPDGKKVILSDGNSIIYRDGKTGEITYTIRLVLRQRQQAAHAVFSTDGGKFVETRNGSPFGLIWDLSDMCLRALLIDTDVKRMYLSGDTAIMVCPAIKNGYTLSGSTIVVTNFKSLTPVVTPAMEVHSLSRTKSLPDPDSHRLFFHILIQRESDDMVFLANAVTMTPLVGTESTDALPCPSEPQDLKDIEEFTSPGSFCKREREGHFSSVSQILFSLDGKLFVTNSDDGILRIWNGVTGRLRYTLSFEPQIAELALSSTGMLAWADNYGNTAWLWNTNNLDMGNSTLQSEDENPPIHLKCCSPTLPHAYFLYRKSVAFSAYGQRLAAYSGDGTVWVWTVKSRELWVVLKLDTVPVLNSIAFSLELGMIAVSTTKDVRVWSSLTDKVWSYSLEEGVSAVAFSPNGKLLAAATDSTIFLFKAEPGHCKPVQVFKHVTSTMFLSFSKTGRYLITGNTLHEVKHDTQYAIDDVPKGLPVPKGLQVNDGLLVNDSWLIRNGSNILYLQDKLKVSCWAAFGNRIALGYLSGDVALVEIQTQDAAT